MSHPERGFDIKPYTRDILCYAPWESPIYTTWGNSFGCFDTEKVKGYLPDIYLAGDSYTWGYAPFEAKFGTILEKKTGRNVLKCGVPHTGQRHQFSKFLDVSKSLGQFPKVVIVNYAMNDIVNDYAYPHSTAINNQLVDNTFLKKNKDGIYEIVRIDGDALTSTTNAEQERNKTSNIPFYYLCLKRYSASFNILNTVINNFRKNHKERNFPYDKEWRNIYRLVHTFKEFYKQEGSPIYWPYGEENRKILLKWKKHSRENNYRLIISLIPYREEFFDVNYYHDLEYYLSQNGIESYNFEDYMTKRNIDQAGIIWSYDSHFNIKGNAVYEDYLEYILQK